MSYFKIHKCFSVIFQLFVFLFVCNSCCNGKWNNSIRSKKSEKLKTESKEISFNLWLPISQIRSENPFIVARAIEKLLRYSKNDSREMLDFSAYCGSFSWDSECDCSIGNKDIIQITPEITRIRLSKILDVPYPVTKLLSDRELEILRPNLYKKNPNINDENRVFNDLIDNLLIDPITSIKILEGSEKLHDYYQILLDRDEKAYKFLGAYLLSKDDSVNLHEYLKILAKGDNKSKEAACYAAICARDNRFVKTAKLFLDSDSDNLRQAALSFLAMFSDLSQNFCFTIQKLSERELDLLLYCRNYRSKIAHKNNIYTPKNLNNTSSFINMTSKDIASNLEMILWKIGAGKKVTKKAFSYLLSEQIEYVEISEIERIGKYLIASEQQDTRQYISWLLELNGTQNAAKILLPFIGDENDLVSAAATRLCNLQAKYIITNIIDEIQKQPDSKKAVLLAEVLAKTGKGGIPFIEEAFLLNKNNGSLNHTEIILIQSLSFMQKSEAIKNILLKKFDSVEDDFYRSRILFAMKQHLDVSDLRWLADLATTKDNCNSQAAEYFEYITGFYIGHLNKGNNPISDYNKWFSENKNKDRLQILLESSKKLGLFNEGSRIKAINALLEFDNPKAFNRIYEMRIDLSPNISYYASLMLVLKGDAKGIDGLVDILDRSDDSSGYPNEIKPYKQKAKQVLKTLFGFEPDKSMDWFKWLCKYRNKIYFVPELDIYLIAIKLHN